MSSLGGMPSSECVCVCVCAARARARVCACARVCARARVRGPGRLFRTVRARGVLSKGTLTKCRPSTPVVVQGVY